MVPKVQPDPLILLQLHYQNNKLDGQTENNGKMESANDYFGRSDQNGQSTKLIALKKQWGGHPAKQ